MNSTWSWPFEAARRARESEARNGARRGWGKGKVSTSKGDAAMETTDVGLKVAEFHAEHVRLGRELMELRELSTGPMDWRRLDGALSRAEPLLQEHIEFEEAEGYLVDVLDRRPNVADEIEALRLQHTWIKRELRELRRRALDMVAPDELLARLNVWLKTLSEHEGRENRLVQGVANDDLGAGD
jgi:hypothetical protein